MNSPAPDVSTPTTWPQPGIEQLGGGGGGSYSNSAAAHFTDVVVIRQTRFPLGEVNATGAELASAEGDVVEGVVDGDDDDDDDRCAPPSVLTITVFEA
jgi:hypothetical protein